MKKKAIHGEMAVLAVLFILSTALSAGAFENKTKFGTMKEPETLSKFSGGARLHDEFPGLPELPVEKDDLSYELMYEFHDGIGYWQVGAGYMPEPDDKRFEYLITPQVNLILKDRIYRLGAGALKTYVKTEDDTAWTDLYWQVIAGLGFPIGSFISIDICAHYVFTDWKKIGDTDMAAVDYTAHLALSF